VVLEVGEAAKVFVETLVFQVYVLAPFAVKFTVPPLQMLVFPLIVTVRIFTTLTVATAFMIEAQPNALLPETE